MFNLPLQTDAYHMAMGYLIANPMGHETHVLYARSGGPQVIADLGPLLQRIANSVPTRAQVAEAERHWREQHNATQPNSIVSRTNRTWSCSFRGAWCDAQVSENESVRVNTSYRLL